MIQNHYKHTLLKARSYSSTYTISDRRLVITTMVINCSQVRKNKNRGNKDKEMKIDTQKLVHCPEIKTKYKEKLEGKLNNQADKTWKILTKVIKETEKEDIGLMKPKTKKMKKYNDKIESLSKE